MKVPVRRIQVRRRRDAFNNMLKKVNSIIYVSSKSRKALTSYPMFFLCIMRFSRELVVEAQFVKTLTATLSLMSMSRESSKYFSWLRKISHRKPLALANIDF
jgi:amino acid permease